MAAVTQDLLSEQLIARLLEDDLLLLGSFKQAEKLQLDHVVAISARAQGDITKDPKVDSTPTDTNSDCDLAFELYLSDAQVSNDAAYAQAMQSEAFTVNTVDLQYAQKLAANERKINLDAEFARRLQAMNDEGEDIDQLKDIESILGDMRESIDPNASVGGSKGSLGFGATVRVKSEATQMSVEADRAKTNTKGKGRQLSPHYEGQQKRMRYNADGSSGLEVKNEEEEETATPFASIPYPTCGICLEAFIETRSPISASLSANSSNRLPFGLRLPCPKDHTYCISCLASYIQNKLDPDGRGVGKSSAIVFPIRCPECPLGEWPNGIENDVAQRVLGEGGMVEWYHQKLLDSIPRLFCPNPTCSSLVEADADSPDPQAVCPSCQKIMCVPCRTRWHEGLSCEEYQALPLDERSPEDRLVLDLAKAEQWRRCPNCAVIVELVSGCNHMTCICGFHFCFKCGAPTTREGRCKSNPPCELWDEEMLLEQRERARNRAPAPIPQPEGIVPGFGFHIPDYRPEPQIPQPHHDDLHWMDDPHVLCGKHWFTSSMVHTLTCGYCSLRLNSLADLRYHLTHVRRHPVYACCGRFFHRRADFDRHAATRPGFRFNYEHAHQLLHE